MRAEIEIKRKIIELRSMIDEEFLDLTKIELPDYVREKVGENIRYIKAGMLIGLAWSLGLEDAELVNVLFDPAKLDEFGLKLEDFDIDG